MDHGWVDLLPEVEGGPQLGPGVLFLDPLGTGAYFSRGLARSGPPPALHAFEPGLLEYVVHLHDIQFTSVIKFLWSYAIF